MTSITIDSVLKSFGDVRAVNKVSVSIEAGELFFLLGPSGCGKTTLLRLLAGFYTPESGRILFDDSDVSNTPPHKRNTGMVFQNYALWPHMTVSQNLAFGLEMHKIPGDQRDERVRRALESVRLDMLAERYPNQLSGGQQQRVALARALVLEPGVVLLDEPLSNLDARLRLDMRHEIKRIHTETGITMVYVTHDQDEALSMADRIAVMRDGVIEQIGSPHELYDAPANRFVAQFMGETNLIEGKVVSGDDPIVVETDLGMFNVAPRKTTAEIGDSVYCSIRPEKIACIENTTAAQNTVAGKIEEVFFLGDHEQYRVVSASGEVLRVSNRDSRGRVKGTDILLGFGPDDAVVLHGN
jgi:iron(III) transport system ATP-binding protein